MQMTKGKSKKAEIFGLVSWTRGSVIVVCTVECSVYFEWSKAARSDTCYATVEPTPVNSSAVIIFPQEEYCYFFFFPEGRHCHTLTLPPLAFAMI